jgi:hypothetical protein
MGSIDHIIETLRSFREDCTRDPETIREYWPRLSEIERKLSIEEKWTVVEQFCMAGIDLHDEGIIEACLVKLNKQYANEQATTMRLFVVTTK